MLPNTMGWGGWGGGGGGLLTLFGYYGRIGISCLYSLVFVNAALLGKRCIYRLDGHICVSIYDMFLISLLTDVIPLTNSLQRRYQPASRLHRQERSITRVVFRLMKL